MAAGVGQRGGMGREGVEDRIGRDSCHLAPR